MKARIYPLRLTKKKWRIPINILHKCSKTLCSTIVMFENGKFVIRENPQFIDCKCPYFNKIEQGSIPLHCFSIDDPRGIRGDLYNPDEIVIPDQKIRLDIDYPLINPVQVVVDFGHPQITKKEVLYVISNLYKYIYDEEERTSPSVEYLISRKCDSCVDKKNSDYTVTFTPLSQDKKLECPICYGDYSEKSASRLPCGHIFHRDCIVKWLDGDENDTSSDNNSCPMCRHGVLNCEDCEGKRVKYEKHESVVIPLEHRGMMNSRNPTFGSFGIYGHDLEDLNIGSLFYDRKARQLYIGICAI